MSIAWQIPSLTKSSCLHFGQKKWCGLLHSLMECSLPLWVPFLKTCQTTRLNKWGARKLMSFHYSRLFATVLWHVWELSRITVNSRSHSPWCHLQGFKVWPVQQAVQAVILWHRFLTTCSSCNIYIYIYIHSMFTIRCQIFGLDLAQDPLASLSRIAWLTSTIRRLSTKNQRWQEAWRLKGFLCDITMFGELDWKN